jgi:alkylated DNA repair dioxygenase AlkB
MELFSNSLNLMEDVFFVPHFYAETEAQRIFTSLQREVTWREEKIKIFGKEVNQPRLIAWQSDPTTTYRYSGLTLAPSPWTDTVNEIKVRLEKHTHQTFNGVLINLYRDGSDYMGWHRDNERELGKNPFIASLSFGATRSFQLKHRTNHSIKPHTIAATSGSLILMTGSIQENWVHRLAPTKKIVGPRINLTFRRIFDVTKYTQPT